MIIKIIYFFIFSLKRTPHPHALSPSYKRRTFNIAKTVIVRDNYSPSVFIVELSEKKIKFLPMCCGILIILL